MIRLHVVAEGQTEETFVRRLLTPHLGHFDISTDVHCVTTSRHGGRPFRGGLYSYARAKRDIELWMRQDRNQDARFTTLFDLYRLPKKFPAHDEARRLQDPYEKVVMLERALAADFRDRRFLPHLQLHEFEALVLVDPRELGADFIENERSIEKLESLCRQYESPELIDDDLPPSKRIIMELPGYEGRKVAVGPLVAERIGLPALRKSCPHFGQWLTSLERLAEADRR
jgi:Domain of unknown function (DUF4276)